MGVDLVPFLELVPFAFLSDSDLEFACVNLLFLLLWLLLLLSWLNINHFNAEQERTVCRDCAAHSTITIGIVRRANQIGFGTL